MARYNRLTPFSANRTQLTHRCLPPICLDLEKVFGSLVSTVKKSSAINVLIENKCLNDRTGMKVDIWIFRYLRKRAENFKEEKVHENARQMDKQGHTSTCNNPLCEYFPQTNPKAGRCSLHFIGPHYIIVHVLKFEGCHRYDKAWWQWNDT